jgi:hypothetical protein
VISWSRLSFRPYATFLPEPYASGAEGLARANIELGFRRDVYAAFVAQPNVTPLWQGWIDVAARDVADHEAVVRRLIAATEGRIVEKTP